MAKPMIQATGVLIGRDAIQTYLSISRDTFYSLIKLGLPASVINGRWYAHRENIEGWFQLITRRQTRGDIQDAE